MAKNYIVTSNHPHEDGTPILTWAELYAANFAVQGQFQLDLIDHQVFKAERVVRIIPKRRMVAFGVWQNKRVVAKIFFDPKDAKKQMEKDLAGVKLLNKNKIPTPEMLYEGNSVDKQIYILIFERITDAKSLDEIWQEKKSREDALSIFQKTMVEIATQHVLGLMQRDLHLKNFLWNDKTIYTLDGAQIEPSSQLLPKKTSMDNLALFLSQLGVDSEGYQEKLFNHYAAARGWTVKPEDLVELFILIKKWNQLRWKKFTKKIFRNSSDYVRLRLEGGVGMYQRRYEGPEFAYFLAHPEAIFFHPTTKLLKAGRSATVIKVVLDQREFVVKRYNMKNIWHRLRRCLRETRACTSWRLAQKLKLFDIATAKPAAFIERRLFGLRGQSYYVTEYVSGQHAGDYFSQHRNDEAQTTLMVKRITSLLKNVAKLEITHGDLKITNILVDQEEQPVLIDLDGAAEHTSQLGFRKAWRKEIRRFLDNFHSQRALHEKFELELEG